MKNVKGQRNPKQNCVQHIVCGILSRYELPPQSIIAGHPFAFGENESEKRRKCGELSESKNINCWVFLCIKLRLKRIRNRLMFLIFNHAAAFELWENSFCVS